MDEPLPCQGIGSVPGERISKDVLLDAIPPSLLQPLAPQDVAGMWVMNLLDSNEVQLSFVAENAGQDDPPVVTYTAIIADTEHEVHKNCGAYIYHFTNLSLAEGHSTTDSVMHSALESQRVVNPTTASPLVAQGGQVFPAAYPVQGVSVNDSAPVMLHAHGPPTSVTAQGLSANGVGRDASVSSNANASPTTDTRNTMSGGIHPGHVRNQGFFVDAAHQQLDSERGWHALQNPDGSQQQSSLMSQTEPQFGRYQFRN